MPPFLRNLLDGLIEDLSWRRRGIEERDIRAILWSLRAVDASHQKRPVLSSLKHLVMCHAWLEFQEIFLVLRIVPSDLDVVACESPDRVT